MTTAVVDIETDSLDASRIHCIVAQHYKTPDDRDWETTFLLWRYFY